jgi:hypothetical protein
MAPRTLLFVLLGPVLVEACDSPAARPAPVVPIDGDATVEESEPPRVATMPAGENADPCGLSACANVGRTSEPVDPRLVTPKARSILVVEIQNLERLLAATPRDDHDHPFLLLRIARAYVELTRSAEQESGTEEDRAKAEKIAKAARRAALRYYKRVLSDHPGWCMKPSTTPADRVCADEIAYYIGLEHERLAQHSEACAQYAVVVATEDSVFRELACEAIRRLAAAM